MYIEYCYQLLENRHFPEAAKQTRNTQKTSAVTRKKHIHFETKERSLTKFISRRKTHKGNHIVFHMDKKSIAHDLWNATNGFFEQNSQVCINRLENEDI